ncbi:deoxyribodipyrimidine photo-lyase [Aeromicrobium sp. IC_218]|uniref:cryptochrome/photolyase family protein n=1 Tax=Aeromicrobium sp. IC_218 TaxID=2545468 RepID=UPI0010388C15|nr:deoxyribodipyrimidine photo-lyase [Aeromicrobium sp. IC_218]TCI98753.1 deoxyribodipyrimidine photo-lyase [Aeromicrobium sp. IC_218]
MPSSVLWFRRDLRLGDNPALVDAIAAADGRVVPLFVLDDTLWGPAGDVRRAYLAASLRDLSERVGGLHVVHGDPVAEVPRVARAAGAASVHVAADYGPYGARRDEAVERALADDGVALVRTGSPYAVAPGRLSTKTGTPFKVFTPFHRAWTEHGWRAPAPDVDPAAVDWQTPPGRTHAIPDARVPDGTDLPDAGEDAARRHWRTWLDAHVRDYDDTRDVPALERGTSRMSVHLKWGEIHPRTMLADLAPLRSRGAGAYTRQLAWRDFYAGVLHERPDSARDYYDRRFAHMEYDEPGGDLDAWREGRTGIPIVDAGMRQLRAEGWMHNRVRMITASFLVKDLHLEWQHGARHFLGHLVDGDLANNQHGWQWVAGCGTDAAPYFRVMNPVSQGKKFDPDGAYVRRWVPELADVPRGFVHEPWEMPEPPADYPPPLVDHAAERREALARLAALRDR